MTNEKDKKCIADDETAEVAVNEKYFENAEKLEDSKRPEILAELDIPEEQETNLSDFALFLTVMKNKIAYRNTLSIILDETDIQLREVKVEQVVLNKSGKRAIRLDAWAVSMDERQFDMEMQNESDQDSLPKRARFYQGLMDSPVLKSGKETKYRNLRSSTIILLHEMIFLRETLPNIPLRSSVRK